MCISCCHDTDLDSADRASFGSPRQPRPLSVSAASATSAATPPVAKMRAYQLQPSACCAVEAVLGPERDLADPVRHRHVARLDGAIPRAPRAAHSGPGHTGCARSNRAGRPLARTPRTRRHARQRDPNRILQCRRIARRGHSMPAVRRGHGCRRAHGRGARGGLVARGERALHALRASPQGLLPIGKAELSTPSLWLNRQPMERSRQPMERSRQPMERSRQPMERSWQHVGVRRARARPAARAERTAVGAAPTRRLGLPRTIPGAPRLRLNSLGVRAVQTA